MKRIVTVILFFLLLGILVVPCLAAEDSTSSETILPEDGTSESFEDKEPKEASDTVEETRGESEQTAVFSELPMEESGEKPEQTTVPSDQTSDYPSSSDNTAAPSGEVLEASVSLALDNENVYEGMDKAYKDGYLPIVENGVLTLVIPLIADGELKDDKIVVTPNLGDPNSSPFEYKNYQKTFYLSSNQVNRRDDAETVEYVESYLVCFDFSLKADRNNGTYSILLSVQARGENGALVQQSFTCYVTITDGVVTDASTAAPVAVSSGFAGGTETKTPESQPKVLIKNYSVSDSPVTAGDEVTVVATLWNTSETRSIQNMVVTVSCDSSNFVLKNESSTFYIGDLEAGGSTDIEIKYSTDLETPAQRYSIRLAMEYDNSDAVTLSSSGAVMVEVAQAIKVELSPYRMASEVNSGEMIQMAFQVMNLGRGPVYNVRLELDVPGLNPVGTAFIGNMEAGTSADTSLNVFVSMKDEEERYGFTSGILRLIYEDVSGQEYVQETSIATTIKELVISAVADDGEELETAERASQWWISLVIGGAVIVGLTAVALWQKRAKL